MKFLTIFQLRVKRLSLNIDCFRDGSVEYGVEFPATTNEKRITFANKVLVEINKCESEKGWTPRPIYENGKIQGYL